VATEEAPGNTAVKLPTEVHAEVRAAAERLEQLGPLGVALGAGTAAELGVQNASSVEGVVVERFIDGAPAGIIPEGRVSARAEQEVGTGDGFAEGGDMQHGVAGDVERMHAALTTLERACERVGPITPDSAVTGPERLALGLRESASARARRAGAAGGVAVREGALCLEELVGAPLALGLRAHSHRPSALRFSRASLA